MAIEPGNYVFAISLEPFILTNLEEKKKDVNFCGADRKWV